VSPRAVKTAIQADLEVPLAGRARGVPINFTGIFDRRAAEMARRTSVCESSFCHWRTQYIPTQGLPTSPVEATLAGMFVPRPCAHRGCGRPALSGSDSCVVHHVDPVAHVKEILRVAHTSARMQDLDLAGITLEDEDLSGIDISGCRLTAANFARVRFSRTKIYLSFLDRTAMLECDFSGVNIVNSVLAGSRIENCPFTDSEIIQGNFLGISGVSVTFDHSDLYGCRFIGSWMKNVSMRDCNVTRAYFDSSHRTVIDFHLSNTNEAVFLELAP